VSLKRAGGDPFTNKNPSYQIAFYMQHSGLAWGILTNGRLWRLYHKETAHKLDRFYEVNLPELLLAGDVQNFLYFYAFFRRQAFEVGALGIEEIRAASVDYARGVGNSLKAQVYEALRHVAQGFLDYRPKPSPADAETLTAIYDNALIRGSIACSLSSTPRLANCCRSKENAGYRRELQSGRDEKAHPEEPCCAQVAFANQPRRSEAQLQSRCSLSSMRGVLR